MAAVPSISFRVSPVMDRAALTRARKHDFRLGPQPDYVDEQRSHRNTRLSVAPGYDLLKSAWTRHLDREAEALAARRAHKTKSQKMWRAAILTFSHEAQALLGEDSPESEAKAVFEDFAARHGVRLLWSVGHHDETAVHYHAMFENVQDDGKCLRLNRADLRSEQDIAALHLAGRGLVRGKAKIARAKDGESVSATIHRSVKQLHEDLPAEIEAAKQQLADMEAKYNAAMDRAQKAEERAQKAEEKAIASSGSAALAQTRLERAQERLRATEMALQKRQQELDRLLTRENELDARQAEQDQRQRALDAEERELVTLEKALKLGEETPDMTAEREADEVAEWGMPYFQAYEINNGGKRLTVRERISHIIDYWTERLSLTRVLERLRSPDGSS